MNSVIKAIMKKDINAVIKNKQTLPALLIVPVMFGILLPGVFTIGFMSDYSSAEELASVINSFVNFLLLIPVMIASMTCAEAIAGEREKKTIETLLYSPVHIRTIFTAKVLGAFVPALAMGIVFGIASMLIVNIPSVTVFGEWAVAPERYIVIFVLLMPALALLSVDLMIYASAKAKSMNAASQWSLLLVFPIIFISSILMEIDIVASILIGAVLIAVGIIFVFRVFGLFTRPVLLEGVKKESKQRMTLTRRF